MVFSWQMAEQLAAAHMRSLGFSGVHVTREGADGGLDVVGSLVAAQVKYLTAPVGSPDIQRLRGAAHGIDFALFYSSSGYSAAALMTADLVNVALFSYDEQNQVTPANSSARLMAAARYDETLERVRQAGTLFRDFRAIGFALSALLTEVKVGTLEPWPTILDETAATMAKLNTAMSGGVARYNAAVELVETAAMISEATRLAALASEISAEWGAKPPPIGEQWHRLLLLARENLETEYASQLSA